MVICRKVQVQVLPMNWKFPESKKNCARVILVLRQCLISFNFGLFRSPNSAFG